MNKLCKLLADNRRMPQRRFRIAAKWRRLRGQIFLYDAIVSDELEAEWFGGVAPQSFVKALREITASTIHLRNQLPGGAVFGARAIEQALREHPANIIAHIDGLAASAAFVAMAADQVVMNKGALFMIHKAWTFAYGNSDDSWRLPTCSTRSTGPSCRRTPTHEAGPKPSRNGWPPKRGSPLMRRCPMVSPTALRRTRPRLKRHGTSAPTARRPAAAVRQPNTRPSTLPPCCVASTSLH